MLNEGWVSEARTRVRAMYADEIPGWVPLCCVPDFVRAAKRYWVFGPDRWEDIIEALRLNEPHDMVEKALDFMMLAMWMTLECAREDMVEMFTYVFEAALELRDRGYPVGELCDGYERVAARILGEH